MRASRLPILGAAVLAAGIALAAGPATPGPSGSGFRSAAATVLGAMDRSVDPCQDFYKYACGGWLSTTQLPADQSRWGRGFTEIAERNRLTLREILEQAAKDPGTDPKTAKLGAFYGSCMDEEKIDKAGAEPLKPLLKEIDGVKDAKGLMTVAGRLQPYGVPALFGGGVYPDFKNPDVNIAFFSQGGLGLPDRDYYLKDDDKSKQTRADYLAHVAKMLELLGESGEAARKHTQQIFGFELALANASRPRAEMRDPEKLYNKIDLVGLKKLTPGLAWDEFLASTGYPNVKDISVAVPEFFQALEKQAVAADPEVLRAYLRWHLVRSAAPVLSKPFADEAFAFYGQKLSGQKEQKARWKRCVDATDGAMGELLGQAFVEKRFPGDSKTIALDMIGRIESAFEANLKGLAWMDDATRARATTKKQTLTNKIGYPDKWRDYSKYEVKAGSYAENVTRGSEFEFHRQVDKIGQPVDKTEWGMTPPTVNAYYNPSRNEIVFPAGILQPPFFDAKVDPAINYGAIGAVIGHEMTHGFDDQGRKFDAKGNLRDWWTPEDAKNYDARAACVRQQFDAYELQPGLHENGKLVLGEAIADLGGLTIAHKAYEVSLAGKKPGGADGFTADQLFFLGFARVWASAATPEYEQLTVKTDPHPAPQFRAIGAPSNIPEFAAAFGCKPGDPMVRAERCRIW